MNPTLLCRLVPASALWAVIMSPLIAQTAVPPLHRPATDETVTLSPFEVTASSNDTYQAFNTNSISGTNRELTKLPLTAEVFNSTFLEDLAITSGMDLLREYATGVSLNVGSATGPGVEEGDQVSWGQFYSRGIGAGVPKRNGFLDAEGSYIDMIGADKTEIIRGPQALLYGRGEPGGVINYVSKPALFGTKSLRLLARTDEYGTLRGEIDANYSYKNIAVRLAVSESNQKYWRDENNANTKGIYGQLAVRPWRNTTVRFEAEDLYQDLTSPSQPVMATGSSQGKFQPLGNQQLSVLVAYKDNLKALFPTYTGAFDDILGGKLTFGNVNAYGTTYAGRNVRSNSYAFAIEQRVGSQLSFQVRAARTDVDHWLYSIASTGILAPGASTNPYSNAWAEGIRLRPGAQTQENEGLRLSGAYKFKLLRGKHEWVAGAERREKRVENGKQFRFYEVDGNGQFIINRALADNTDAGRTEMPIIYLNLDQGFSTPYNRSSRAVTVAGRRYVYDWNRLPGSVPVSATNPLGINTTSAPVFYDTVENAVFGVLFSSWFNDRLDTMIGLRRDSFVQVNPLTTLETIPKTSMTNGNVGLVYHLTSALSLYAGASSTYRPNEGYTVDYQNYRPVKGTPIEMVPAPFGEGRGFDAGVKYNFFDGRLSGSISYFRGQAKDERQVIPSTQTNIVNPGSSINTRPAYGVYTFDREAHGYEVNLTGRILPTWRVMLGYSFVDGQETSDVYLPRMYNDEFRVNAAGQVTLADGAPLRVPVTPNTPNFNPLNPAAGVATQILTLDMLRRGDDRGNYRASLDPESGRITNAAALYLTTAGVGTGRTWLPIADHQLGWRPATGPADTYLARASGDQLNFVSKHSFSLTTNYQFTQPRLRGVGIGGNVRFRLEPPGYFYVTPAGDRKLMIWDDMLTANVFVTYQRRVFRDRVIWKTQFNVNNVFDSVHLRYAPNAATGTLQNVYPDQTPRTWMWTNSLSF